MARGRNVINQSIALEGGDEIVAMLRKMGDEGEAAARKLEAAFRNVSVGKSFGSAFANLKSQFAGLQAAGSQVADSFGRVGNPAGCRNAADKRAVGQPCRRDPPVSGGRGSGR